MKTHSKFKKIAASLFISVFLISSIPTHKAEAQWVDFSVMAKEYTLDSIVSIMGKAMIKRLTASTVNWINSGFQGNPAYVTNPNQFFGNVADGVAGQLIAGNPNFKFMCAPFSAKVRLAVTKAYNQPLGNFQCSLTGVAKNFDNFIGDFDQGGWDGFLQITQNPQNNPIGLYTSWQNDVTRNVASQVQQKKDELAQGNGFLSFQKCKDGTTFTQADIDQNNADGITGYKVGDCNASNKETVTPGSVISGELNKTLGTDQDSIVSADEISELVGALIGQLTNKVLSTGLGALSGNGSAPNGLGSYTNSLVSDPSNGASALEQRAINMSNNAAAQSYPCFVTVNGVQVSGNSPTPTGVCTPNANNTNGGGTPNPNPNPNDNLLYVCNLPDGSQGIQVGPSGTCQPGGTNTGFIPITASDGSLITSPPTDPQCASISFDLIVARAGQLHNTTQPSIPISTIVRNMACVGGNLP